MHQHDRKHNRNEGMRFGAFTAWSVFMFSWNERKTLRMNTTFVVGLFVNINLELAENDSVLLLTSNMQVL